MKPFLKPVWTFVPVGLAGLVAAVMLQSSSQGLESKPLPKFNVETTAINRDGRTEMSYAPIVKKAAPSVVTIYSTRTVRAHPSWWNPLEDPFRQFFGGENPERSTRRPRSQQQQGLGSGVIVSPDGYILTANHVIDGADADGVKVTLAHGGRTFTAKVVGTDSRTDVAVLKVDATDLPAITIADSDQLEVGDVVLAIGNPFDVGQTVTKGIVSATGRTSLRVFGSEGYENFIQTDAAINPGNSGGALVDAHGRLIGINSLIFSRSGGFQGVGFAVPSNLARSVLERLVQFGKVTRGYMGVMLQGITPDLAEEFNLPDNNGAMVTQVNPDTPAAKAGLRRGDVIRELDGRKVSSSAQLRLAVSENAPGKTVSLTVLQAEAGKKPTERKFTVTLGELPDQVNAENGSTRNPAVDNESDSDQDALDGVEVGDLSPNLRRDYEIPRSVRGALVTNVDEDSNSAKAGLRPGDVIQEINHEPVRNADDAVALSKKAKGNRVLLLVWRDGGSYFLTVNNRR
jgi:serine protease Do